MTADLDRLFADEPIESGRPIPVTNELKRVLNLPSRPADIIGERIAGPLTKRLRARNGEQSLRPLQALALVEAHDFGGAFVILPVGEGKTLITFLLPVIIKAERPLLLIPAKLSSKTQLEFNELQNHWKNPKKYGWLSYELISRRPEAIDEYGPDLIIADECHKLKNPKAACSRRVWRYLRKNPDTKFVGLSGTIADRSFLDYWHLQQWALPAELQPLPHDYPTVESWSQALDEKVAVRRSLGALEQFAERDVAEVRRAFGRRLRNTPGVIGAEGSTVGASIQIERVYKHFKPINEAVEKMRNLWQTPDGVEFCEATDLWRHARELANGFYYKWTPEPPIDWLMTRNEFNKFVRDKLRASRTLDTMAQVLLEYRGEPVIEAWRRIKNTYKPQVEPVWITQDVLEYADEWASDTDGLVWVEHIAVGKALEDGFGLPYFGEQGLTSDGRSIVNHEGAAAVSVLACSEGFNLQRYNQNLILNAPPLGSRYEQLLGRTHRYGQTADEVYFRLLFTVTEQFEGFEQARADALYIEQTTGQKQKLVFADYI